MRNSELAHRSRSTLKGEITAFTPGGYSGYTITSASGGIYSGVQGTGTWKVGDKVTFVGTDRGYMIIGYAASGQNA